MVIEDKSRNNEYAETDQLPSVSCLHAHKRSECEAFEKLKGHVSGGKTKHSVGVVKYGKGN